MAYAFNNDKSKNELATVATSGSYNDLSNKPSFDNIIRNDSDYLDIEKNKTFVHQLKADTVVSTGDYTGSSRSNVDLTDSTTFDEPIDVGTSFTVPIDWKIQTSVGNYVTGSDTISCVYGSTKEVFNVFSVNESNIECTGKFTYQAPNTITLTIHIVRQQATAFMTQFKAYLASYSKTYSTPVYLFGTIANENHFGPNAFIHGSNNKPLAQNSFISGSGNKISYPAINSVAFGKNNEIYMHPYSMVAGFGNRIGSSYDDQTSYIELQTNESIFMFGRGLEKSSAIKSSLITGEYNYDQGNQPLFVVGNGTSSSRSNALQLETTGNLTIAGTLTQNSDKRLKEHIKYISDDACDFIKTLKPALFVKDGEKHTGFYAQDVQESDQWDADIVKETKLTEALGFIPLGVNYADIIAPLVAYCQQLEKRIEQLEQGE